MGAQKISSIMPLGHLGTQLVQVGDDALAEIPRTLAGNAATLAGHVVGGDTLDSDTPNPAPRAPGHGLHGHDHSGGIFGRPLYRTVAAFNFSNHDLTSGTIPISQNDVPRTRYSYSSIPASQTLTTFLPCALSFFVPGCDPGPYGAYSSLGISIIVWVHSATSLQTGDSVRCILHNRSNGDGDVNISASNLAVGYNTAASSGDDTRITANVGQVNTLTCDIQFRTSATVASRSINFSIGCIELGVYSDLTG